jgi:hypothetical protein
MLGIRLAKPERPMHDDWRRVAVRPRQSTLLGISFRPRQVEAFGLEGPATLDSLLKYPFDVLRLAAYWDRIETATGEFDTSELDWQLAATERARKMVILSIGPIKNFGYPEYYVPKHQLDRPLREGVLVRPEDQSSLLSAAKRFISRVVTKYRSRDSVVAWQLEHEAVDPLGFEHSWRLGRDFVEAELEALRKSDPSRPVMMNGFLPTSSLVKLSQGWRTRDQGDSLAVAAQLADIVGGDYYPRNALVRLGPWTLYADGSGAKPPRALFSALRARGRRWMVAEGQAEPWETTTLPPDPPGKWMYTCGPHHLIENYNAAVSWSSGETPLYAYLFWGAEYWILRARSGDPSYLDAFQRVLNGGVA